VDNIKEFNSASGKNTGHTIIIVILSILVLALGYLYFNQKKTTEVKIVELTQVSHEKETVTFQYQNLLDDYNSLVTSNDSIAKQPSSQKNCAMAQSAMPWHIQQC